MLGHYLENDLNVFDHVSNEAKDEEQGSQDAGKAVGTVLTLINNIADKDPDAASEIGEKAEQNLNVPEDVAEEGLSDYYRNDLNRLDPQKEKAGKKHKDSGNIMNDDNISVEDSRFEPELLSIPVR